MSTLVERLIAAGLMTVPRNPEPGTRNPERPVVRRNYPVITDRCRRCGRVKIAGFRRHALVCRARMRKR